MNTDALIPKEILEVLNTPVLWDTVKLWHVLILSLIVPTPVAFAVVLFMMFPRLKDKAVEMIRNGGTREGSPSPTA